MKLPLIFVFFQLFCYSETWEVHCSAMSDIGVRILPSNFLSERPMEAGFCLWLLHPDPYSRPKLRCFFWLYNSFRDYDHSCNWVDKRGGGTRVKTLPFVWWVNSEVIMVARRDARSGHDGWETDGNSTWSKMERAWVCRGICRWKNVRYPQGMVQTRLWALKL